MRLRPTAFPDLRLLLTASSLSSCAVLARGLSSFLPHARSRMNISTITDVSIVAAGMYSKPSWLKKKPINIHIRTVPKMRLNLCLRSDLPLGGTERMAPRLIMAGTTAQKTPVRPYGSPILTRLTIDSPSAVVSVISIEGPSTRYANAAMLMSRDITANTNVRSGNRENMRQSLRCVPDAPC